MNEKRICDDKMRCERGRERENERERKMKGVKGDNGRVTDCEMKEFKTRKEA